MQTIWPDQKKCSVALCFDFDAETLWFNGGKEATPTPTSRGEYAAFLAVPRILDLLDQHEMLSTFFVPGYTVEKYPEIVREIKQRGHEIGHHGFYHETPVTMDYEEEKEILEKGIRAIEEATGSRPLGYRSPAWDLSHNSLSLLSEFGFLYDSSMMADEKPYVVNPGIGQPPLVEIPVEWLLDDAPHFLFNFNPKYRIGMADPDKVYRIWKEEFDGYYQNEGCFNLTMHPQVIGRYHRINLLDDLITYMKSHSRVWFARCIDIAKYWHEKNNTGQGG